MTGHSPGDLIAEYRRTAAGTPDLADLRRAIAAYPPLTAVNATYLAQPLFVPAAEITTFAADLRAVVDLAVSLPERVFDGDAVRYCAALGVDERSAKLLTRRGWREPPRYGRADVYHDGHGFRLLEIGLNSAVGSTTMAAHLPRALLAVPEFAEFACRHDLGFVDTADRLATAVRTAAAEIGVRDPVVALVEAPGGMRDFAVAWGLLRDDFHRAGLVCHVAEIGDLSFAGGRLRARGAPVDVVFRCFTVDEIVREPDGEALFEPIRTAVDDGVAVHWTPLDSHLYGNKACLALLSTPARRNYLSPEEIAVVDRVLPETRRLAAASVPAYAADGTELMLKPNASYRGIGAVAGWAVTPDEWARALAAGAAAGCVVQRRVRPRIETVVDPAGTKTGWHALWGVFYTPDGYAGCTAKAVPAGVPGVVTRGARAAVFHHPA
ncbi:hypothetical protein [Amycolatopsis sp. NPDC051061]|uniref:hypothetical protein n=1 Tax=Amycolatopsis sp. NPDC051061 TaxID=3155042 RepID=UPI0034389E15